jgi:hypothetical protein
MLSCSSSNRSRGRFVVWIVLWLAMLGVVTCDADVEPEVWRGMLRRACDASFNVVSGKVTNNGGQVLLAAVRDMDCHAQLKCLCCAVVYSTQADGASSGVCVLLVQVTVDGDTSTVCALLCPTRSDKCKCCQLPTVCCRSLLMATPAPTTP